MLLTIIEFAGAHNFKEEIFVAELSEIFDMFVIKQLICKNTRSNYGAR